MSRIWKLAGALILVCFVLCGCGAEEITHQQITCEGLTITLPAEMRDRRNEGYYTDWTLAYGYGGTEVMAVKEEFSVLREYGLDPDLNEYAAMVADMYEADGIYVSVVGSTLLYFELPGDGVTYGYYAAVYEGKDAFWTVYISCPADAFGQQQSEFTEILESVVLE